MSAAPRNAEQAIPLTVLNTERAAANSSVRLLQSGKGARERNETEPNPAVESEPDATTKLETGGTSASQVSPPHHTNQRQAHLRRLHFASVVIFSILTLAGAAYVIYDILRLTLSTTGLGPAFFIIVLGSTVLLFLAVIIISGSRVFTVRRALRRIPRGYVPIGKNDVSRRVHKLILQELVRAGNTKANLTPDPLGAGRFGWGVDAHTGRVFNYRRILLQSTSFLEQQAVLKGSPKRSNACTLESYILMLVSTKIVADQPARRFASMWSNFRYSNAELSEKQWNNFLEAFEDLCASMRIIPTFTAWLEDQKSVDAVVERNGTADETQVNPDTQSEPSRGVYELNEDDEDEFASSEALAGP